MNLKRIGQHWQLTPSYIDSRIRLRTLDSLSPVGHDAEEDLPELGARLVVLRRHVRHQVHDQSPDDVVVDDPGEKEGKTPYRPVAKETSATQNLNCLSHRSTPSMSVEQVLSEHHILNSAYCTKVCFPKNKLNIKLLHNMLTEHIVN